MKPQYRWDPSPLKRSLLELSDDVAADAGPLLADYRAYYGLPEPAGTHRMYKMMLEGYELAVQQWRTPNARGNLLMVHGYYDHVGLYGNLIEFAQQQQLNILTFDLPGHGLSSGEPATIDDFDTYQRVFDALLQHGQGIWADLPWIVAGQSTGGATLTTWLMTHRPEVDRSIVKDVWLLAPLLRPTGWNSGRWVHSVARFFIKRLRRRFTLDGNNRPFFEFVARHDPLQASHLSVQWVTALKRWIGWMEHQPALEFPMLMIQGTADNTVEGRHNLREYQRLFPSMAVEIIIDGQHHLVNETPERLDHIFRVLQQRLKGILAP